MAGHPKEIILKLLKRTERMSPLMAALSGFALVALVGALDFVTGDDFGISVFYLAPIFLLTWSRGIRVGVLLSALCGLLLFLIDVSTPFHQSLPLVLIVSNAFVKFCFFSITAVLFAVLKDALGEEKRLARTDFLTGLANRREFSERVGTEIHRSRRYHRPFTVAYVDIDDFKSVNDRFGHEAGDELLKLVGRTMMENVRSIDVVARLGGDEFALLFPEIEYAASRDALDKVASKLREAVDLHDWPVTFSVGAMTYRKPPRSVEEVIRNADKLMYDVKKENKNSIRHEVGEFTQLHS